jgi:hypothetical protein
MDRAASSCLMRRLISVRQHFHSEALNSFSG